MGHVSVLFQVWSSVIYGQNVQQVFKKYMDPFHLPLRDDSRIATYYLCVECHYFGVDL
jgi:hypothetical protein